MKPSLRGSDKNPVEHLDVKLKIKRGLMSSEWVKVQVLKFSASGMTVRTDEDLQIGGKCLFSIHLAMDFGDITIAKVEAIPQSRAKVCSCFDYPLQFSLPGGLFSETSVTKSLERIDALLSSYDSLVNKIKSGPFAAK